MFLGRVYHVTRTCCSIFGTLETEEAAGSGLTSARMKSRATGDRSMFHAWPREHLGMSIRTLESLSACP